MKCSDLITKKSNYEKFQRLILNMQFALADSIKNAMQKLFLFIGIGLVLFLVIFVEIVEN